MRMLAMVRMVVWGHVRNHHRFATSGSVLLLLIMLLVLVCWCSKTGIVVVIQRLIASEQVDWLHEYIDTIVATIVVG